MDDKLIEGCYDEIVTQIERYGFDSVLAAICRYAHVHAMNRTFMKLNKIYEWYLKERRR